MKLSLEIPLVIIPLDLLFAVIIIVDSTIGIVSVTSSISINTFSILLEFIFLESSLRYKDA